MGRAPESLKRRNGQRIVKIDAETIDPDKVADINKNIFDSIIPKVAALYPKVSALKLGQARGAAIVAATNYGLEVYEYSARKVKQSVVGKGNAEKSQVQHMVKQLLSLEGNPQEDAADALAIALCHAHTQQNLQRIAGASHSRRGRIT